MRYGCVIGVVYSEILNAVGLSMALEPSQQILLQDKHIWVVVSDMFIFTLFAEDSHFD